MGFGRWAVIGSLLTAGLPFALGGCVDPSTTGGAIGQGASPQLASQTVQIDDSQFEQSVRFLGIEQRQRFGFSMRGSDLLHTWFLRSWMDRNTGRIHHQAYIAIAYESNGWRFYNRVNDDSARSLDFVSIYRDVISCSGRSGICSYDETFGATVPDEALRQAVSQGRSYCVRASARDGSNWTGCFPVEVVRAQLAEIDTRLPPSLAPRSTNTWGVPNQRPGNRPPPQPRSP